jgi:hypothetical protein
VTVDYLACMTAPRSHLLCTVLALAALPALAQEPLTDRLVRDAVREAAAMESPAPAKVEAPVKFGKTEARQKQIDRLFQQAADAAPPKLYEAPKITEYNDGSPYGRRIYKVTTAMGTYCIKYETNHAPDGIDIGRQGLQSKVGMCPVEF